MNIEKLKEKYKVNETAVNDAVFNLKSMVGQDSGSESGSSSVILALSSIFSYFKIDCRLPEAETDSVDDIKVLLAKNDLLALDMTLDGKWWRHTGGAVLAFTEAGDMVALLPDMLGYRIVDVGSGKKRRFRAGDAATLRPQALNIFRNLPKKSISRKDFKKYCLGILPAKSVVMTILLCVLTTLLSMCVPIANKNLFSEVIPSGDAGGILPICGFLLGASISSILFQLCRNFALVRSKDKFNEVLQSALMNRLLFLPSSFFKKYSSGNLGMRVLSANNVYQLVTSQMLAGMAATVFSVLYILVAFLYAKQMIIVISFTTFFGIFEAVVMYRFYKRKYNQAVPYAVSAQDFAYNSILGIQKIKNCRAEQRAFAQWAARFSKSEMVDKYGKMMNVILICASNFLAHYVAWKSNIAVSDFVAFMSAFGVMTFTIAYGLPFLATIANISPYVRMLDPILEAESEDKNDYPQVPDISGSIDINHVSFRYTPDSPMVLNDLSLHIPSGQNVAIVGKSGCGKSTLMRLMLGFEEIQSGSIFYGQFNLSKVNLGSLRQFVGFCPQSMQIFPGTIAENIRFSTPSCTSEDIWRAAAIACLDEDIRRMPKQMDTLLGEGGSGLSGGQCQRLLIARAVINNPKVLLLDEATSALDNITQKRIIDNLTAFGCTRIAIAHRLSTVMNCDRVVVLDKGKIIEDGSPAELMARQGFFFELSKRQL